MTGSETGEECPPGTVRPPSIPAEFEGPFVLFGADGPECPPGLMTASVDTVRGDATGQCSCMCDLACDIVLYAPGTACDQVQGGTVLTPGDCEFIDGQASLLIGTSSADACSDPVEGAPEAVAFGFTHRVCAGTEDECVPVPDGALGPCLRTDTAIECPPGFGHRIDGGTDIADACNDCASCVEEANEQCSVATVTSYDSAMCMLESGSVPAGVCGPETSFIALTGVGPPMCAPTTISGDLVGRATFCCPD